MATKATLRQAIYGFLILAKCQQELTLSIVQIKRRVFTMFNFYGFIQGIKLAFPVFFLLLIFHLLLDLHTDLHLRRDRNKDWTTTLQP